MFNSSLLSKYLALFKQNKTNSIYCNIFFFLAGPLHLFFKIADYFFFIKFLIKFLLELCWIYILIAKVLGILKYCLLIQKYGMSFCLLKPS